MYICIFIVCRQSSNQIKNVGIGNVFNMKSGSNDGAGCGNDDHDDAAM